MKKTLTLFFVIILLGCNHLVAQWTSLGAGVTVSPRTYLSLSVVDENIIWALPLHGAFTATTREVALTIDGGNTWNQVMLPDSIDTLNFHYLPVYIFALDEFTAWVVLAAQPGQLHGKIFKTTNGGAAWVEQYGLFNVQGHCVATLHFFNANEGLAFGSPGSDNNTLDSLHIYSTANGGDTWIRIDPATLPTPMSGEGVWVYNGNHSYEAKGDTLWFGTRAGRIFKTTDKGLTWNAYPTGLTGSAFYPGVASVAFENSMNGIAVSHEPANGVRTTDGGITWTPITVPSNPLIGGIEYIPGTNSTYMIVGGFATSSTLSVTKNGGQTWSSSSHVPPMMTLQFISPTVGYAGRAVNINNNTGLYKWAGNLSDSVTSATLIINDELKLTMHPNPVMDYLHIKASDNNKEVIEIYETTGRMITRVLVEENELSIDVRNINPGFYYLKYRNRMLKFIKQ